MTLSVGRLTIPDEQLDWRTKGFWLPGPAVSFDTFIDARHNLFGGAFTWPVLVGRRSAIEHNIATMADYCCRHGVLHAPHAKTTMAPSLFAAQLGAGAWGMTAATANQILALRRLGVPRVMLANELVDPVVLRWLAGEIEQGFEFVGQVDSLAGVDRIAEALAPVPGTRPMRVLVEVGYRGGRTGCRTSREIDDVALAAHRQPRLSLAGVAGYEGGLPGVAEARRYLGTVRDAVERVRALVSPPTRIIVAAGGSAYFDVVAEELGGSWAAGHDVQTILRSGAYISHDDGFYRERSPFSRNPDSGSLTAALQVWAQVTSVPEPGLAIVGMGKREVSFDEGLPVPQRVRRRDGAMVDATGLTLWRLNDHHGYVEIVEPARLDPGDLVCFGISHPCTAFDKWQVIPVVDDDGTVRDLLRTYF